MAKRKPLPALTPRARQVLNLVINAVALGTHDNDAEIGAMAKQLGMTQGRLQTVLRKLEEQGWLTVRNDFVYPTIAALRWQNPELNEREAHELLRQLK
jgi:DNA-binding MarR family transcriptional regulator